VISVLREIISASALGLRLYCLISVAKGGAIRSMFLAIGCVTAGIGGGDSAFAGGATSEPISEPITEKVSAKNAAINVFIVMNYFLLNL
jgi:hypothetical protein